MNDLTSITRERDRLRLRLAEAKEMNARHRQALKNASAGAYRRDAKIRRLEAEVRRLKLIRPIDSARR